MKNYILKLQNYLYNLKLNIVIINILYKNNV